MLFIREPQVALSQADHHLLEFSHQIISLDVGNKYCILSVVASVLPSSRYFSGACSNPLSSPDGSFYLAIATAVAESKRLGVNHEVQG